MRIDRCRVLSQRFYDIADEVDLARAEALVQKISRRPRFVRSAKTIRLPHPPVELALGSRPSPIPGLPPADVLVRIYDVGALAVTYTIELPEPIEGEALIALARDFLSEDDPFLEPGRLVADEIATAIKAACKAGRASEVTEDYTIFRIYATTPKLDADELPEHLDVARLLLGETGPISRRERMQQSHAAISYGPDELVIADWNSALVYDPSPNTDLTDLLEMTGMQLLELRVYDDLVGRSLLRLYDELESDPTFFRASRYQRLSREIMRLFVDVTEMSDRIDNSLKTLGDSWLARVHHAAVGEFDIPRWQRHLQSKLEVLRKINELLIDQITARKSLNVELAIVALIVLEIVLALFKIM